MDRGLNTRCLHLEETEGNIENYGDLSYPIYQTATYAHAGVGKSTGYDYTRLQNPTREHLEKIVASLEGGIDAFALSSGMAAITLLMELFEPGDHIIAEADLYGGSIRLFDNVSKKNHYEFTFLNCSKDNIEESIRDNTKAIYIETPTNPMMNISDIAYVSTIAKKHNLMLIVDNTFLSPYFQNPLKFGADVVIHSGTKFLGGHNDTLAGFIVTNKEEIQLLLSDCRCVVCKKIGFQAQKQFEKKAISVFDVECEIKEALDKITFYYNKIDRHESLLKNK